MTRWRSRWLAVAVTLCSSLFAIESAADSLPATLERIKPSIVGIGTYQATRRPPGTFGGTGFVIGDGRHIITNAHTVPDTLDSGKKEHLAVLTGHKRSNVRRATLLKKDLVHDLAVLRFEGSPLPALKLGDSSRVREGKLYAFTGFPIGMVLGFRPVTHRGIVSAITPIAIPQITTQSLDPKMVKRLRKPYEVFQLDATAYPGNSGSPLYDMESGEVVGVINKVFVKETKEAVLEKPSGITYAIPSEHVSELLRKVGAPGS